MSMIESIFKFARRAPKKAAPKAPAPGLLLTEQAVDSVFDYLSTNVDTDIVLQRAGLTRSDLRELMYDDEISAAMETRQSSVESTPWRLEPGEGAVTDYVWGELELHIDNLISGAFSALAFGYSVIELVYEPVAGKRKVKLAMEKPFEWFRVERDGTLKYISREHIEGEEVDTNYKFLLTRHKPSYTNPLGEAILSRLYLPWFFRGKGWQFWAKFLERFGSPFMVGKTEGDPNEMASALALAVQAASIAVGREESVELISSANDGGSFERFQVAIDKRIQKVLLGQTLTTDTQGVGSQALGNVHNEVREDRAAADLKMVGKTIQQFVDAIVALNFPGAASPEFLFDPGTGIQADRADRDAKLTQAGVLRFTEQYLLDRYDFEVGDFEVGPALAPAPAPVASAQMRARSLANLFAAGNGDRFTPQQLEVESLSDSLLAMHLQPIAADRLRAAVLGAGSPEELFSALAAEVSADTDTDAFRVALEQALFVADLLGYSHASKD